MRWPKVGVVGHFSKCGEVGALPAPRSCVFASSSWPSSSWPFFRSSEITELRKCVDPRWGSLAISLERGEIRGLPAPLSCVARGFVGFHSRRASNHFLEFPKLRNCENVLTQSRGLRPCPRKSANLGTSPSHAAAFLVASLAFMADAPQTRFLENTKL